MVNAHPTILLWLCDVLDIESECLREYVFNREEHIAAILTSNPGLGRDDVKTIFLALGNGGTADYSKLENKTPFVVAYKKEVGELINRIVQHFQPFHTIVARMKRAKKQDFNINGATVSHILQYVENQLLMIIFNFLEERISDKVQQFILCYDGIMILKSCYMPEWQQELEAIFRDEYGIDIKLKIKEMTPLDLTQHGFNEDETYRLDYVESIADTEVSSYRSILDNADATRETDLLGSQMCELDTVRYMTSFGEEFIFAAEKLHHFNGVYWDVIDSEYIYNILEVIHIKLACIIADPTFFLLRALRMSSNCFKNV